MVGSTEVMFGHSNLLSSDLIYLWDPDSHGGSYRIAVVASYGILVVRFEHLAFHPEAVTVWDLPLASFGFAAEVRLQLVTGLNPPRAKIRSPFRGQARLRRTQERPVLAQERLGSVQ